MPGPAGRHHVQRVVLVGGQPDGRGLHPQRHVLGDQHDLAAPVGPPLGGQVERAGQDAAVVGVGAEAGGEHLRVGVVELDVQGSAAGRRSGPGRPGGRARCAARRACAAPCGRTTRARGGAACPPVRRSPPAAGRPRARRTGSATTGRTAAPRCRARRASGVGLGRSRMLPRGRGTAPTLWWAGRPWRGPADAELPRGRAHEGRVPAPSGATDTTTRASPGGPHRVRHRHCGRYRRSPGCGQQQHGRIERRRRPELTRSDYRSSLGSDTARRAVSAWSSSTGRRSARRGERLVEQPEVRAATGSPLAQASDRTSAEPST